MTIIIHVDDPGDVIGVKEAIARIPPGGSGRGAGGGDQAGQGKAVEPVAIRKIDLMHEQFGKSEHLCKDCGHFLRERYRDKAYRKCEVYGVTSSEASDWKASYQA